MVEEEVHAIFTAQRERGQTFASAEREDHYLEILLSQRSFDEGPGQGRPYGGSQIEKMIGKCTLETGEPRAAKASYSFEYFTLLQNVNHLRRRKQSAFRRAAGAPAAHQVPGQDRHRGGAPALLPVGYSRPRHLS